MPARNNVDWKAWLEHARGYRIVALAARGQEAALRPMLEATHAAVERLLKAAHLRLRGELAPRSHNLIELAALVETAGLRVREDEKDMMRILDDCFIPVRYPQTDAALPTQEEAVELLDEACRFFDRIEVELAGSQR